MASHYYKDIEAHICAFKEHLVLNIILSVVFFAIGFILLTWLDKYQAKKVVDTRKKEEKIQNVA